jgi:DNA-binding transcriptional LysR family regulator
MTEPPPTSNGKAFCTVKRVPFTIVANSRSYCSSVIERSSHRFRVTELGKAFYERCQGMLIEAERAKAVVCEANSEPQGPVRLPEFLARYPRVQLQVLATDRRVDLVDERIHVAIRARATPETETGLTMRMLGRQRRILVATPEVSSRLGSIASVAALCEVPTLSMHDPVSEWVVDETWQLVDTDGLRTAVEHRPRLSCKNNNALLEATRAGAGVALLPAQICSADINEGKLVHLLPQWSTEEEAIYLVFTTARGLPPAVRVLIDFLAERFQNVG